MRGGGRHRAWPAPRRVWDNARELFQWRGCAPVAQRRDERESGWNPGISNRARHPPAAPGTDEGRMADMHAATGAQGGAQRQAGRRRSGAGARRVRGGDGAVGLGQVLLLLRRSPTWRARAKSNSTARAFGHGGIRMAPPGHLPARGAGGGKSAWPRTLTTLPPPSGWWSGRAGARKNAGAGARAVHRRTPAPGPGARR